MRFLRRFTIKDWNGKEQSLTATEIYVRVMHDSKSDYDWFTNATELVRVCNLPNFPKKYAEEIKIAILNCFVSIWSKKLICDKKSEPTADYAVYSCYNSLNGKDKKTVELKRKYLYLFIEDITIQYAKLRGLRSDKYMIIYSNICKEWINTKLKKYSSIEKIDFEELQEALKNDFDNVMKIAESQGVFGKREEQFKVIDIAGAAEDI